MCDVVKSSGAESHRIIRINDLKIQGCLRDSMIGCVEFNRRRDDRWLSSTILNVIERIPVAGEPSCDSMFLDYYPYAK